ncbi:hypothetical protein [Ruegeria marina]|uniref:Uncharacterized protein n=1 Tax=Ruegeria marina TaxID=639004 RepID=A0A1G6QTG4_9RHOB|nr:hypothetical protein [Ruegeria marina]SDC95017.1 hypothetical protein SAMN04488239_104209 [Ruegeria marina]
MKAFASAVAMMIVVTVAAPVALDEIGFSAADRSTGRDVRLD